MNWVEHLQLALLLAAVSCSAAGGVIRVAWVSDIHYDPFYGTSKADGKCTTASFDLMGTSGCDSPIALVESAMNSVKDLNPEYLVMSGDWLRHGMSFLPMSDAIPTFSTVAQLLGEFSGGVIPLPNTAGVLGNNDYIPDYFFNLSAPVHPLLANMTSVMRNYSLLDDDEASSFSRCAFYYRELKNSSLSILSLNTLVWTVALGPSPAPASSDPCGQFEFLHASLESARSRRRRVLLVSHIPVGMNAYDVLNEGFNTSEPVYFQDAFAIRYAEVVSNYSAVIIAQLYGHTHKFAFLADRDMAVPAFIAPAISPIFENNPSYLVVTLDAASLDLVDLQQHYLAINKTVWVSGQTLRGILGIPQLTVDAMRSSATELFTNDSMWKELVLAYGGGITTNAFPVSVCGVQCRATFCCSLLETRLSRLEACAAASARPVPVPNPAPAADEGHKVAIFVLSGCIGLLAVGAAAVTLARRKRWCLFGTDKEQLIQQA